MKDWDVLLTKLKSKTRTSIEFSREDYLAAIEEDLQ